MAKFKCVNADCVKKEEVIVFGSMKWVFSKTAGKLIPKMAATCSSCGQELEYIKNEFSVTAMASFNINKFDSMTPNEKRAEMRKRSQTHFQKTDNGDLARLKKKVIDDNRNMVLRGGK